jgi:multiple antibiotic resistance protein
MNDYFSFALLCFTAFITIINPISTLPVFLSMTANFDRQRRTVTAKRAVITAFIAMVFFAFTGKFIFDFFHITANGFRVAGGILFFIMGFEMLGARISRDKITKKEMKNEGDDISITPLGIPMICGPGAITNSILIAVEFFFSGLKPIVRNILYNSPL